MALNRLNNTILMSDGGGNGKKHDPYARWTPAKTVETVDSLHAGEDVYAQTKAAAAAAAAAAQERGKTLTEKLKTSSAPEQPEEPTSYKPAPATTSAGLTPSAQTASSAVQEASVKSAYEFALERAMQAGGAMPTYKGSFDEQIADLYAKINGREPFSYDLNGDGFWQQYADKFTQGAKMAMTDTMGQAAALTGGYGSSYAQAVGQQAYDRRMEELMDIAPELYDKAYKRYTDEGDALLQRLSLTKTMADDEYDRWRDEVGDWRTERAFAEEQADKAYKMQQDNQAYILSLIALGYEPTSQELSDAGLTSGQYAAIKAQYEPKNPRGPKLSDEDYGKEYDRMATSSTADTVKTAAEKVAKKLRSALGVKA